MTQKNYALVRKLKRLFEAKYGKLKFPVKFSIDSDANFLKEHTRNAQETNSPIICGALGFHRKIKDIDQFRHVIHIRKTISDYIFVRTVFHELTHARNKET